MMSSPDGGGGNTSGNVNLTGDKGNQIIKQNAFPIDLAPPKIALVKPTDGKGATVQAHQFRTLTQQPMRVVMPTGAVQTTGTAQIIQTHLMPQAMLKQVDALGRTQITALPSRTMAQTSITVTRPLTPNTFMPRGVTTVTNMGGPRGTIRAQTPPISTVTNISAGFVRGTIPPRTPSPAGTVINPSGTTWMTGSQPVQLIRASIGHSPRTRIVSQNIPAVTAVSSNAGITTISANIVSSQSGIQSQTPQQNTIQTVSSGGATGQPQTFVATLATVLPPRQQTATLVYSNPQQFGTAATGQRLAVGNPISGQRQVRPIQISNARLPTTGLGVRVSSGNISLRGPSIPVLAPSSVLTSLQAGTSTTVTSSNLVTGLPAARIIQVQQQNQGGTAQVLSTGRITGNLMTLHPLVMNASAASANTVRGTATTAKPSLTITHVGKVTTPSVTTTNLPQGATITASVPSSTVGISHHTQQQHIASSAPIGIVMGTSANQAGGQHQSHQIAQIVNLNQSGINVGHGHQIQIIGSQGTQQGSSTVVPLTITSRPTNTSLSGTTVTTLPASVASNISQIVQRNVNLVTSVSGSTINNSNAATVLPIAKVLPQQQNLSNDPPPIVSVSSIGNTQNVYIHSRSPSNPTNLSNITTSNINITNAQGGSIISAPSGTYYMPVTTVNSAMGSTGGPIAVSTAVLQSIATNTSSITTNVSSNTTTISASYAPQAGPFAVVPSSNRSGTITTGLVSTSTVQGNQPVRFNPQLIVDGNSHTIQGGTIISMHQPQPNLSLQSQSKQGHMLMPVSNTKSVTIATASTRAPTIISTASRKRDQHGEHQFITAATPQIKSAVKNLQPTLMAIASEPTVAQLQAHLQSQQRPSSPISRPGSTDGSTTVSATSSPGIDEQEQEELNALSAMHRNNRNIGDGAQFKNVDNLFGAGQKVNVPQMQLNSAIQSQSHIVGFQSQAAHHLQSQSMHQQTLQTNLPNNNGNDELTPRKRARKQQLSEYGGAQNIKKYNVSGAPMQIDSSTVSLGSQDGGSISGISVGATDLGNKNAIKNSNTDTTAKPVGFFVKKPKTCTLLDSYKQTWKGTSNHFQRYSDVKPREERRPTVMDLANQAHVVQKVNGWKIYHLSSQMEDLTELESQVYDKLASMLQCMEAHNQNSDVDRVNDLIKGNMQRSKIVSDSINEARAQILKVFDHKSHVSDIIHRCASKRNFKKREKC